MPEYYLRVDAVNLDNFVFDTNDISTIRGGSFILLDAINGIAAEFGEELESIATAASTGLFAFQRAGADAAYYSQVKAKVLNWLHEQANGHATFVAAVEQGTDADFPLVLEKLETQIHRQQFRLPTVTIPEPAATSQECFVDGWRPGVIDYKADPDVEDASVSAATDFRRELGRERKRSIFRRILEDYEYDDALCARDLGKLARHDQMGVLSGKIALIHADGNSFGKTRRKTCTSADDRKTFDELIQQNCRVPFLKSLLELARSDPDFQTTDEDGRQALRLEVLLWGGDEMTLVVPAWRGWQVLELFFNHAKGLNFKGHELSHRAAIIFCHHNAPILQIRRLAGELERQAKRSFARTPHITDHNALHYLVLESFDMLQGSFDKFLERYYQKIDFSSLLLRAAELPSLRENLSIIHQNVARSKLFGIIDAIRHDRVTAIEKTRKRMVDLIALETGRQVANAIDALVKDDPARWYLITDLWDYIPEWKPL